MNPVKLLSMNEAELLNMVAEHLLSDGTKSLVISLDEKTGKAKMTKYPFCILKLVTTLKENQQNGK